MGPINFNLPIIALHGATGSGKDTIGKYLVEEGYRRISFGDQLRQDMYDAGFKQVEDERAGSPSFKDHMIEFASEKRILDPTRYVRMVVQEINKVPTPIVVTDCRRVVEVLALLRNTDRPVYIFQVQRPQGNPHPPNSMDDLMGGSLESIPRISNILGTKHELLDQIRNCMTTHLPARYSKGQFRMMDTTDTPE